MVDNAMGYETSLVKSLEAEYDLDVGFLGQLRRGIFDPAGLDRLLALLDSINLGEAATINRRLVALLWMIPSIMAWQVERVTEQGGDVGRLRNGIDKVQAVLNSVLGTP